MFFIIGAFITMALYEALARPLWGNLIPTKTVSVIIEISLAIVGGLLVSRIGSNMRKKRNADAQKAKEASNGTPNRNADPIPTSSQELDRHQNASTRIDVAVENILAEADIDCTRNINDDGSIAFVVSLHSERLGLIMGAIVCTDYALRIQLVPAEMQITPDKFPEFAKLVNHMNLMIADGVFDFDINADSFTYLRYTIKYDNRKLLEEDRLGVAPISSEDLDGLSSFTRHSIASMIHYALGQYLHWEAAIFAVYHNGADSEKTLNECVSNVKAMNKTDAENEYKNFARFLPDIYSKGIGGRQYGISNSVEFFENQALMSLEKETKRDDIVLKFVHTYNDGFELIALLNDYFVPKESRERVSKLLVSLNRQKADSNTNVWLTMDLNGLIMVRFFFRFDTENSRLSFEAVLKVLYQTVIALVELCGDLKSCVDNAPIADISSEFAVLHEHLKS